MRCVGNRYWRCCEGRELLLLRDSNSSPRLLLSAAGGDLQVNVEAGNTIEQLVARSTLQTVNLRLTLPPTCHALNTRESTSSDSNARKSESL